MKNMKPVSTSHILFYINLKKGTKKVVDMILLYITLNFAHSINPYGKIDNPLKADSTRYGVRFARRRLYVMGNRPSSE